MTPVRPQTRDDEQSPRLRSAPPLDSVVCFKLAKHTYALDVSVVREVVRVDKLLPVPRTPAPIAGVFALRGATIALVDARILFGRESSDPAADGHDNALIVARGHRTICGLTVDAVLGVVRFIEHNFTPAIPGREPEQVAGFLPDERGGLLTVLDASVIISSLERLRF
jgi:chemotaxis signal transduction protein